MVRWHEGLGGEEETLPCTTAKEARVTAAVETSEHGDDVARDGEVDEIGEAAKHRPTEALVDGRIEKRSVAKPAEKLIDGCTELASEVWALELVPTLGFQDVLLGELPNDDREGH